MLNKICFRPHYLGVLVVHMHFSYPVKGGLRSFFFFFLVFGMLPLFVGEEETKVQGHKPIDCPLVG